MISEKVHFLVNLAAGQQKTMKLGLCFDLESEGQMK